MALKLIMWRLASLKTTIEINQFFPKAYFAQRFSVERTFDPEYAETYITLGNFIKKYSIASPEEEPSWGTHTAFEVETFRNYDAPDFKKYLYLKFGSRVEDERSVDGSFRMSKTSSETKSPTSNRCSANHSSKEQISLNGYLSGRRGRSTCTTSENLGDQISLNSRESSNLKAKLKALISLGYKKKTWASQLNERLNTSRTEALLVKHDEVISARRIG